MRSKIFGTGSYLPKKILTNDDLTKFLETSDEWITTRTGIKQRHIADLTQGETTSFMALEAAKKALTQSNLTPSDIDMIIVATVTPDYRLPSTACLLQNALGARHVPAFDLAAACSGSLYALSVADSFIRSGSYKKILVVASEMMSSAVNWSDRNTAILFGDGASAAVIGVSDNEDTGFLGFELFANGEEKGTIFVPKGGSSCSLDAESIASHEDKIVMNGRETFKFAVRAVVSSVELILNKYNITPDDITFAVPHQANLRIIEAIAERVGLPMERFLVNLDRCANTSAVSLLLAYDEAVRQHRIKPGDLMLMLGIGAGFTWGGALYRS